MSFESSISYSGQKTISTIGGQIRIEEGRGRMVIYDPNTQEERQVHTINGSRYNDENGVELTRVDTDGITVSDDNEHRARFGRNPQGTRVNAWVTPDGTDVLDLLESEA